MARCRSSHSSREASCLRLQSFSETARNNDLPETTDLEAVNTVLEPPVFGATSALSDSVASNCSDDHHPCGVSDTTDDDLKGTLPQRCENDENNQEVGCLSARDDDELENYSDKCEANSWEDQRQEELESSQGDSEQQHTLDVPEHSSLCGTETTSLDIATEQLRPPSAGCTLPGESARSIAFMGTSADGTLVVIGTAEGEFFIFSATTNTCLCHQAQCGGPVVMVEMLICSSIVAVVVAAPLFSSEDTPPEQQAFGNRDIQLWNMQKNSRIAVVSFTPEETQGKASTTPATRPQIAFDEGDVHVAGRTYEAVVAIRLSHRRLVAFLDCPCAEIEIFELRTLQLIHRIERNVASLPSTIDRTSYCPSLFVPSAHTTSPAFTVPSSLAAVAAFSVHPWIGYLAVPIAVAAVSVGPPIGGSVIADERLVAAAAMRGDYDKQTGSVALLDLHRGATVVNTAELHAHPLAAMRCNGAATMLVTASVKGTMLRVWALPSLEVLWLWRRGSRPAKILSVDFSWNSHYIWVASSTRLSAYDFRHLRGAVYDKAGVSSLETSESPTVSIHVFACARTLTALQRKKHAPPRFPRPALSDSLKAPRNSTDVAEGGDDQRLESADALDIGDICVVDSSDGSAECTSVDFKGIHGNRYPLGYNIERARARAWSWQGWLKTTARARLKTMMEDYVVPHLPDSFRETFVDAQKSFAIVKLRASLGLSTLLLPILSVTLTEHTHNKTLEVSVFTSTGCSLSYVCDARLGGLCKLRAERPLIYPTDPPHHV